MQTENLNDLLIKCSYCGYCEYVCPIYFITKRRVYSPRWRVKTYIELLNGVSIDKQSTLSLYLCLRCSRCIKECPAEIDIPNLVLEARKKLTGQLLKP